MATQRPIPRDLTRGLTDLDEILAHLDVAIRPDPYVFATVDAAEVTQFPDAAAMVREDEGLTVVLTADAARRAGVVTSPEFAWLTLTVESSLEAVGLTAAVSAALTERNISCNVLAGYHHDHLLVPFADRDRAVAALRSLR
ncbi:MAG: ACT domain-containing protein [Gordonia sp. (in: high G+C Gram-positive bacteria)]|uniref:ACT domain-containing protein n=1 Tax=Gordonia sp. (in: high G+C Gram-positive bacteria) TaxID=84139 RepID=UPI0039E55F1F